MASLLSHLRAHLSGLTAVDDRVYKAFIPQRTQLPCVLLRLIDAPQIEHLRGTTGLRGSRVQIDCLSREEQEADDVREEVRLALQGFTGAMNGLQVVEISMAEVTGEYLSWQLPIDGSDSGRFVSSMDLIIWNRSTVPVVGGLQGMWRMDENSGSRLDASYHKRHLSDGGDQPLDAFPAPGFDWRAVDGTTGKHGSAAQFTSGKQTRLLRANAEATSFFFGLTDFTIAGWINVSSLPSPGQIGTIVFCGADQDIGGSAGYWLGVDSDGKFLARISDGAERKEAATAAGTIVIDTWYHFAAVFNRMTKLSLYIDGSVSADQMSLAGLLDATPAANALEIGGAAGDHFLDGAVDTIGIWNRVVSLAEINWIYSDGDGRDWPFERLNA